MHLFTNDNSFGGTLKEQIAHQIARSKDIVIASGYVSNDIIKDFTPAIKNLVKNQGSFNLIVGMAFFEGTSSSKKIQLMKLHETINPISESNSGVKLVWKRRFHGKIYYFKSPSEETIYVGSSNFSDNGLINYLEATVLVDNQSTVETVKSFLQHLNSSDQSVYIDKVRDLPIIDSSPFRDKIVEAKIESFEARQYDVSTISLKDAPAFDISFDRIDRQSKSNLNTYFGEGRLNSKTGIVVPRNWFEVEIITSIIEQNSPLYPQGDFIAITDDGYEFPCRTQGDNYKNLRSKNDLKILGKWIKKKLQDSGALKPLTPVTTETLDRFGSRHLKLYKLTDQVYFLEFKRDDDRYKQ